MLFSRYFETSLNNSKEDFQGIYIRGSFETCYRQVLIILENQKFDIDETNKTFHELIFKNQQYRYTLLFQEDEEGGVNINLSIFSKKKSLVKKLKKDLLNIIDLLNKNLPK